jgi:hypothetical protein
MIHNKSNNNRGKDSHNNLWNMQIRVGGTIIKKKNLS